MVKCGKTQCFFPYLGVSHFFDKDSMSMKEIFAKGTRAEVVFDYAARHYRLLTAMS